MRPEFEWRGHEEVKAGRKEERRVVVQLCGLRHRTATYSTNWNLPHKSKVLWARGVSSLAGFPSLFPCFPLSLHRAPEQRL